MKINFHNKVEIFIGDKCYVSYNTVLRTLYEKLSKLEPYADYFAFGSGKVELADTDTKLGAYIMTKPATTTEVSADPEKGVYFVKKTATFDSSDNTSLSFSEIGICSENVSDPTIYNHILIRDENGDVVTVEKNPGESLVINMTIFLDISSTDNTFLTLGENNLVKLLLGETFVDNTIYAVRGYNMEYNKQMHRSMPKYDEAYKASILTTENDDGSFSLDIVFKLGEGEAREVVFFIDNNVVARRNIMEIKEPTQDDGSFSVYKQNNLLIGEHIKNVIDVKNSNGVSIENYEIQKYGLSIGDQIDSSLIDGTVDNEFVWKSLECDKIAFLQNEKLVIVKAGEYGFEPVHTGAIDTSGLCHVSISENFVVVTRDVSPYIEIYKITNNVCVKQNFYKANYDQTSYSYDYDSVNVIKIDESHLKIGVVLKSSFVGLVLDIVEDEDGLNLVEIYQSSLTTVDKVLVCERTRKNQPKIIFITESQDDPVTPYGMQCFGEENESIGYYSQAEVFMSAKSISAHGDYVLVNVESEPYAYLYDTKEFNRASFKNGVVLGNIQASSKLKYVYGLWSEGKYHAFYFVDEENLLEFDTSFLDEIMSNDYIDKIEFLGSLVLVYTNDDEDRLKVFLVDNKYTTIQLADDD